MSAGIELISYNDAIKTIQIHVTLSFCNSDCLQVISQNHMTVNTKSFDT